MNGELNIRVFISLQINQISDPVSDSTYKDLWLATAKVRLRVLM